MLYVIHYMVYVIWCMFSSARSVYIQPNLAFLQDPLANYTNKLASHISIPKHKISYFLCIRLTLMTTVQKCNTK